MSSRVEDGSRVQVEVQVPEAREPTVESNEAVRSRTLYSTLRLAIFPLLTIFGCYFLLYAAYNLWIAPAPLPLVVTALVTAMTFLGLRWFLSRWTLPLSWTDPMQSACALLGLFNIMLRLLYEQGEGHSWDHGLLLTADLGLLIIAVGFFILSHRWFVATTVLAIVGWGTVAWATGFSPDWSLLGRFLLISTAITFGIRFVRFNTYRRLERLQERDARRQQELQRALAAARHEVNERQRVGAALQESEQRYRDLSENAIDIVYTLALDGRFTYLNKAAEKAFGYRLAEDPELSFAQLVDQNHLAIGQEKLQEKLGGRDSTHFDFEIRAKDGRRVPVEISSRLIVEDGKPVGVHAIARDVTARKQAEAALRESETRYRTLVEHSPGLICVHDLQGVIRSINRSAAENLGYERPELIGRPVFDILAPWARGRFFAYLDDVRERGVAHGTMWILTKEGEGRAYFYHNAVLQERGKESYVLCHAQDVTEQRKAQRVLATQRRVLEMVASGDSLAATLDTLSAGLKKLRVGSCSILMLDESGKRLQHGSAHDLPAQYVDFIDGLLIGPEVGACGSAAYLGQTVICEDIATDPRWETLRDHALVHGLRSCWSVPIFDSGGSVLGTFAIYANEPQRPTNEKIEIVQAAARLAGIAIERHRAEKRIKELAFQDHLTGLPNRWYFHDQLVGALAQAHRRNESLAVFFIDLDRFKGINDSLGHSRGDELLRGVAKRLNGCVRESDTVARLGGDEFTLILPLVSRAPEAVETAERILEALRRPYELDGREYFVTASMGIALYPTSGTDVDSVMKSADMAMYRAKERGRDNYQLYSPEMRTSSVERLSMETHLRRALDQGELRLYYQPLVDLKTNAIRGFEALLRWNHPNRGLILPADFIQLTEMTGVIIPIGAWVLQTACAQLRTWHDDGHADLTMAINLSMRQLQDPKLLPQIRQALTQNRLPGESLHLEITETHAMENAELTRGILKGLKELGVKVCIDDFGIGHSSLNYLKRFPIDSLKIDRAFVKDIITNRDDAAIATAVIVMAHALDLRVIAEGVETPEQRDFLAQRDCDLIQGFLIAEPRPAQEAETLLGPPALAFDQPA